MRKLCLAALTVFVVLICSSCYMGINPGTLDFEKSFSFTAALEYNGSSCEAGFTRGAVDKWEGMITRPYALQGVRIDFTADEMKIAYSGFTVDSGTDTAAFTVIKCLENAFKKQDVNISAGREKIEITGAADGALYILTLDKSGLPASLEVPDKKLKVIFSDVKASAFNQPVVPSAEEETEYIY